MLCPHCNKELIKVKVESLPEVIGDDTSISLNHTRAIVCPKCNKIISIICSSEIEKFVLQDYDQNNKI